MNRFAFVAAALALCSACAQDKQTVDNNQNPADPSGTIVGFVSSLRTGLPLQGVTVTTPHPGGGVVTATSDSNGAYSLGGLAAGASYLVRFSLANHVTTLGNATIPNTAGNYPANGVAQLDVELAQSNSTLSGHVYARNGAPAQGVVLTVDLRDHGFVFVATSAATDAAGAYTLSGLPGAPSGLAINVVAQPWDATGDGVADYNALTRAAVTYPAATSILDFDLRTAAADLLLLTTNLESGVLPAAADISLSFNRAVDLSATDITLYDNTTAKYVAVGVTANSEATVLTITPNGGTDLAAFHSYTLSIAAVGTNGDTLSTSRSFTADVPITLLPAVTGLVVSPIHQDYDTSTFTLTWDNAAGAYGYQIWVRDTSRNPTWVLAKSISAAAGPTASTSVTLPSTFDFYAGDVVQTPFAFGVGVDFAVVASNRTGDAPLPSTATAVRRTDDVKPNGSASQNGNADNSAGVAAKTVTLSVTFGEYMDLSAAYRPTFSALPAGLTYTWAWSSGTSGAFTITVPAGTNGTGAFTITGARDTSGNSMNDLAGNLTTVVQLIADVGFESGSLSSYTTTFSSTAPVPVISTAQVASGSYSVMTGVTSYAGLYGNSTVYQTVTLPSVSSITASVAYRYTSDSALSGHDYGTCYVYNTSTGGSIALFNTYTSNASFSTATANITAYAGYTVRFYCLTYLDGSHTSNMYVDNLSILASP